jgi:hypothetical protein
MQRMLYHCLVTNSRLDNTQKCEVSVNDLIINFTILSNRKFLFINCKSLVLFTLLILSVPLVVSTCIINGTSTNYVH